MMIIEALPVEPQQWSRWLEQQIVSPTLAELVEELTMQGEVFEEQPSLDSICGAQLADVWQYGLRVLTQDQIAALMDHPETLFELQDRAFEACSPYWDALVSRGRPSLNIIPAPTVQVTPRSNWLFGRALTVATMAAAMFIAAVLYYGQPSSNTTAGWGLANVQSLSADLHPAEFLSQLSSLSAQWSRKQPVNSQALLIRLQQFRAGCQALIEHPKPQLSSMDKKWLEEKCQKWSKELDVLIASLQQDRLTFDVAAAQASDIANRMTKVLKEAAQAKRTALLG